MKKKRNIKSKVLTAFIGLSLGVSVTMAKSADRQAVDRGRYLVTIAGCNDCRPISVWPGS